MTKNFLIKNIGLICFSIAFLGIQGCVSQVVLETTKTVSQDVQELNLKLKEYQQVLENDAAKRIDRIASQKVNLLNLNESLDMELEIWKLLDRKQSLKIYEGVQKLIVQALSEERDLMGRLKQEKNTLKKTQEKYKSQQKALTALSKKLGEMGEELGLEDQLRFFADFGKATYEQFEKINEDTKEIKKSEEAEKKK